MCGSYGYLNKKSGDDIKKLFTQLFTNEEFNNRYNIRPTQKAPIILYTEEGFTLTSGFWSFLPSWSRDKRLKFSTFNARNDRLMESKLYSKAVPQQRCLILADYFFEPDRVNYPKPKPAPWHLFKMKDDSKMMFAGLYNPWNDPETKEKLLTFTIVTVAPNELVGKYHDRSPAILNHEDAIEWLNPDNAEPEQVLNLLKPFPADLMEQWQVDDAAKNSRNDYPELIKPVNDEL